MTILLISAAVLTIAIGIAHSWLGERFIIRRLLSRSDLPTLFGDDSFTRQTLRFAWHLTTVAWFGLAAVLVMLSGVMVAIRVSDGVVFAVAQTFIVSSILALIMTRGRHLSWIVFAVIAALCLVALT
ncbi:MAG: hypothetical protein E4H44_06500 [Candidatus Aminicenantes bacterium]|nr:MAG: hypothetical protein E4H44_06500 [Candidatus Aminicenantes bacterium]